MNAATVIFTVSLAVGIALFTAPECSAGPGPPTGPAVAHDYNGDGYSDVMYLDDASGLLFELQLRGVTIQPGSTSVFTLPANWVVAGDGDFNGDRKTDLLLEDTTTGLLFELLLDGTTILPASTSLFTLPSGWVIESIGDYNKDGFDDILLGDGNGLLFSLLIQGTTILPTSTSLFQLPAGWSVQGSGDFNDDGFIDVMLRGPGLFFALLVQGTTVLPGSYTFRELSIGTVTLAGIGNYDNLNSADVMLLDRPVPPRSLRVVLLDGPNYLTSSGPVFNSNEYEVRATGDYNNDQFSDLMLESPSGTLLVLFLNGKTLLPSSTTIWTKPAGWSVVPTDTSP